MKKGRRTVDRNAVHSRCIAAGSVDSPAIFRASRNPKIPKMNETEKERNSWNDMQKDWKNVEELTVQCHRFWWRVEHRSNTQKSERSQRCNKNKRTKLENNKIGRRRLDWGPQDLEWKNAWSGDSCSFCLASKNRVGARKYKNKRSRFKNYTFVGSVSSDTESIVEKRNEANDDENAVLISCYRNGDFVRAISGLWFAPN